MLPQHVLEIQPGGCCFCLPLISLLRTWPHPPRPFPRAAVSPCDPNPCNANGGPCRVGSADKGGADTCSCLTGYTGGRDGSRRRAGGRRARHTHRGPNFRRPGRGRGRGLAALRPSAWVGSPPSTYPPPPPPPFAAYPLPARPGPTCSSCSAGYYLTSGAAGDKDVTCGERVTRRRAARPPAALLGAPPNVMGPPFPHPLPPSPPD
jgi:hypothetical protein